MTQNILVVDDDAHIRDVICFALDKAGYSYQTAENGKVALNLLDTLTPDLMVLDVGMPEMDGLETCREIRKSSELPILFLSARDEEIDRILGLEMGGDDYVTKPFSPRELVARIKGILKRATKPEGPENLIAERLQKGLLALEFSSRQIEFDRQPVAVTAREFSILNAFLARPNIVFTRDQLMTAAYGAVVHVSDRTIDSHVRNIRAKFVNLGCSSIIETVHGIGFRMGNCLVDDSAERAGTS